MDVSKLDENLNTFIYMYRNTQSKCSVLVVQYEIQWLWWKAFYLGQY